MSEPFTTDHVTGWLDDAVTEVLTRHPDATPEWDTLRAELLEQLGLEADSDHVAAGHLLATLDELSDDDRMDQLRDDTKRQALVDDAANAWLAAHPPEAGEDEHDAHRHWDEANQRWLYWDDERQEWLPEAAAEPAPDGATGNEVLDNPAVKEPAAALAERMQATLKRLVETDPRVAQIPPHVLEQWVREGMAEAGL